MRITGLEHEISRFQVISLMTGTGFTTTESELILRHPFRRKIGLFLILFGVFSLAVVISYMTNMMAENFRTQQLIWTVSILAVVLLVLRLPGVSRQLSRRLEHRLEETYELQDLPVVEVLLQDEDDMFVDVPIHEDSEHLGGTMEKLCHPDADVNLLLIKRGDHLVRKERMKTKLQEGDTLFLYGSRKEIETRFAKELEYRHRSHEDENKAKSLV